MQRQLYFSLFVFCLTAGWSSLNAQIITTLAGTGVGTYNGDGIMSTAAAIRNPTAKNL